MEIKTQILEKIKDYNKIVITRHIRPDGDCIGSAMGLKSIIKNSFPDKEVYAVGDDKAEYTKFIDMEDVNEESLYENSLVIVVDTATSDRISNKREWLKKASEIIKIDHHLPVEDYGSINYVRCDLPACSAIIADFLFSFDELKIDDFGAEALYTGIVTDTGRFRYRGISPLLFEVTSKLMTYEIDTENIYMNLYTKEKEVLKLQGYVLNNFKTTPNNVSSIYFSRRTQKKYNVTAEEAASLVGTLGEIKDSLIWVCFIELPDGKIRVRIRSRFVAINEVASRYRGGGHQQACGATLLSKKEVKLILNELDNLSLNYKKEHPEVF